MTSLPPTPTATQALHDPARLVALERSGLLGAALGERFDRLTRLAARLLDAPLAQISLIGAECQVNKSTVGLPPELDGAKVPLTHSFCKHVVNRGAPLVVSDTRRHPLVIDNPAVEEHHAQAYLGVPLRSPDGAVLGALCVVDTRPRSWDESDRETLSELSALASGEIERLASARRQRGLFEAGGHIVFLADGAGAAREVGPAWGAFTGQRPGDEVGWGWAAALHPEDRERATSAWRRSVASRVAHEDVFRVRGAAGAEHRFRLRALPIHDDSGRFVEYAGVLVDVEEARQTRDRLREFKATLMSFFEASPLMMGVVELRDDEIVHRADNAATAAFFGASAAALEGRGATELGVAAEVIERWRAAYRSAASGRGPVCFEYEHQTAHGPRWLSATVAFIDRTEDGHPRCSYVAQDVTERHATEVQLREGMRRLDLALEAGRMGIWSTDLRTGKTEWSPEMFKIYGVRRDDFDGSPEATVAPVLPEDRAQVEDAVAHAQAAVGELGAPVSLQVEYRIQRGLTVRWCRLAGRAYPDRQGQPACVTGTVVDITEEKQYEALLVEAREAAVLAREQAEEAARARASILHNMSHEIRTPLTSVLGFADVLAEELGDAENELVAMIQRGGRRLLDTLNSVLEVAQVESAAAGAFEDVDVAAEAAAAVGFFEQQALAQGLTLTFEGPPQGLPVWGSRGGVQRVLANLIANAVKFTDEGGVTVRVRADEADAGRRVVVTVADTGIGMDAAFVERAFRPFEQESTGIGRRYEGTGLGLSIVLQLVEAMGGEIGVQSERGVGTTVRVVLPAAERGLSG